MAKKVKTFNEVGRETCGAKTKSRKKKDGSLRTNKTCTRSPMPNGRCYLHGGKSTGPKNSLGYWKKQVTENDREPFDIENPLDLLGELGIVRSLITRMQDDPLKAYCQDCKHWVTVNVECPQKEYDNAARAKEGKKHLEHFVKVRDNNFSDAVKATKMLSDIAKAQKEITKGKEVTIRIEILNFMVNKVVEAYELSNNIKDPNERRLSFVNGVERLLVDVSSGPVAERLSNAQDR